MSTQTEVMIWMREKRLQDALETPGNEGQHENIETVLHMMHSGEIAPLWAAHDLYFCNGLLLGSTLPDNWRSLPGRVWHEPECGLAHEFAAFEEVRLVAVPAQIITWATKGMSHPICIVSLLHLPNLQVVDTITEVNTLSTMTPPQTTIATSTTTAPSMITEIGVEVTRSPVVEETSRSTGHLIPTRLSEPMAIEKRGRTHAMVPGSGSGSGSSDILLHEESSPLTTITGLFLFTF
jgi:hypothetical protein